MRLIYKKLLRTKRVIAIISLSLSSMASGFYIGQLFIIHGQNYSEGTVIFPGLVIILAFPAFIIGITAKKKEEQESKGS